MQPPLWPQLLLQVILILFTAFFSNAEAAILSLNELEFRQQAGEGDRTAQRLLAIQKKPVHYLTAVRICSLLTSFLSAAFAAGHFAGRIADKISAVTDLSFAAERAVYTVSVVAVTVILVFIVVVFGEFVPKRAAVKRPEKAARFTCGVVCVLSAVLRPLAFLLNAAANGVLRLIHIDPNQENDVISEEGILKMVDIGEEKGAIETAEKELIENIFEFNNTTAEDVMVHRTDMVMLWVEAPAEEVFKTIEESGRSRFPVYEEDADDIIGVLNTRDWLLNARRSQPKPLRALLRPAYFVPESVRADALFRDMQGRKVHLSIVVDEYGGTSGLVTMEDLLEEIVGNIYDEFDPQEDQEIVPLEENLWRIAGGAELDEVAEVLEVEFPEDEDSETLGGLVFAQLPVIPEDGSHPEVDAHGLHIQVERLADRRVEWALVSKLPPVEEEPD